MEVFNVNSGGSVAGSEISSEEYFSIDAVNQSLIKQILRSPAHAELYLKHGIKTTPAMEFGTAVHATVLNPDNFDNEVAVKPENINRRTKAGKEEYAQWSEENANKAHIDTEQAAACISIAHKISLNETATSLLLGAKCEQSYLWRDKDTSTTCKARVDIVNEDKKVIADLKTTVDASPEGFARTVVKFGYHIQAAFYLRGVSGYSKAVKAYDKGWEFSIIAVESGRPHGVACYKLDKRAIEEGDYLIDKALKKWLEATVLNQYNSYPDVMTELSLPKWALTSEEDS